MATVVRLKGGPDRNQAPTKAEEAKEPTPPQASRSTGPEGHLNRRTLTRAAGGRVRIVPDTLGADTCNSRDRHPPRDVLFPRTGGHGHGANCASPS